MKIDNSQALVPKSKRRAKSSHSADQLDKTISHIYDAAVDRRLWPKALSEILRFVGTSGTHLWLMNGDTSEVTHSIHVGMPDKMIEEYNGDVIKACPRWANARKHPDRTFLFDYQHIEENQIDSNEYYHWLKTKGDRIRYYLGGRLRVGNNLEGFQSLAFRKQEGHAQKKHIERFSRVLPHIQRAMQIGQRLGTWQFVSQSALELLDSLARGVIILDETGNYIAVNRCAERLLTRPFRISLTGGRLKALDTAIDQQLNLLIGHCAATASGKGQFHGGSVSIPREGDGVPLRLYIYPLRLPHGTLHAVRSAVVICMLDTANAHQLDHTMLRNSFGLTPAESRLVASVLKGNSVGGASRELKISKHTARSQLKNVFAKVGVHRQAELVRAVLPLLIKP